MSGGWSLWVVGVMGKWVVVGAWQVGGWGVGWWISGWGGGMMVIQWGWALMGKWVGFEIVSVSVCLSQRFDESTSLTVLA